MGSMGSSEYGWSALERVMREGGELGSVSVDLVSRIDDWTPPARGLISLSKLEKVCDFFNIPSTSSLNYAS
jgi:hypothetical protein